MPSRPGRAGRAVPGASITTSRCGDGSSPAPSPRSPCSREVANTRSRPTVGAYPARGIHAGWFIQLGPQLLRHTTPSPVPEWNGMTTTTVVGEVSTGFEYRSRWIARLYTMLSVGEHTAPWVGASFGWTL